MPRLKHWSAGGLFLHLAALRKWGAEAMSKLSLLLWGKLLCLFCHHLLEVNACTQNAPQHALSAPEPQRLSPSHWSVLLLLLSAPPDARYSSGPLSVPAISMPVIFKWTFQRHSFTQVSSWILNFHTYSFLKLPEWFSVLTIFFLPLYKKQSYHSYISNLIMVLCPTWLKMLVWGKPRILCLSLSSKQVCKSELASERKFWIQNKVKH